MDGLLTLAGGVPTLVGGRYLGQGGTYLGWEVYLPWLVVPTLAQVVPTLAGGTYLGWQVTTLARGYLSWSGGKPTLVGGERYLP